MKARALWQKYFETYDAFILPVTFTHAFPHDQSIPQWHRKISTPNGPRDYEDFYFWITFATYTGLPATVAPLFQSGDNFPIGIQIMGPYLEDATPIDIAIKTRDLFGGYKPPLGY
jgi:amidase